VPGIPGFPRLLGPLGLKRQKGKICLRGLPGTWCSPGPKDIQVEKGDKGFPDIRPGPPGHR
jgi:hypothetical protein